MSQCGNGARCFARFVRLKGLTNKRDIRVSTANGRMVLSVTEDDLVRVNMGEPNFEPSQVPFRANKAEKTYIMRAAEQTVLCGVVSMGNPHCVIFQKEDVDDLDLTRIGPKFEHHPLFPERVNTEFVNVLPDGSLKMRVWERGSGETWACGTGSCATGVAACLNGFANKNEDIVVHLRGGDLTIRYTDETVFMTGAATTVFKGEIEI